MIAKLKWNKSQIFEQNLNVASNISMNFQNTVLSGIPTKYVYIYIYLQNCMPLYSFTLFRNFFHSSVHSETVTMECSIALNSLFSKFSISGFRSLKIMDELSEIIYKPSAECLPL